MKKKKGGSTLPRKKKGFRLAFKSYWQLYVLVLPAVLYFLVFNYLPLYGIQHLRITRQSKELQEARGLD